MTSLPPNTSAAGLRSETGSISEALISQCIGSIVRTERSGDLIVESGASARKVTFDRGFVVFASSNLDELRVGNLLLDSNRVTAAQLKHILEIVARDKCLIGEAIIQSGFLTPEELDWELERQVRTIATSLYAVREGTYRFDEHPCRVPEKLRLNVSIYRVQLEGIRNIANVDLIEKALTPLGRFVKTTERPPFNLQDVQLEPPEIRVSEAARTPVSIQEIVRQIGEDRALGLRSVYGLLSSGVLELTDAPLAQPVPVPEPAAIPSLPDGDREHVSRFGEPADDVGAPVPRKDGVAESAETEQEIARLMGEIKIRRMVKDTEGVASMLGKVVRLAPDNPNYAAMFANTVASLPSKAKEAEPHFRRVLALDPKNARLRYDVACYYRSVGMPSRALAELKTALRIDPGLSEARSLVVELKQKNDGGLVPPSVKKLFS